MVEADDQTFQSLAKFRVETVHLVENSEKMREIQRSKLSPRLEQMGGALKWEDDIGGIQECE